MAVDESEAGTAVYVGAIRPESEGLASLNRRKKVNRVQRGRLGGLKAAATKAADTGRYKDPLLETCRSCRERKILVVNGVCIACREKQKQAD